MPYCTEDPKTDHNSDNHPCMYISDIHTDSFIHSFAYDDVASVLSFQVEFGGQSC